ncbi:MAG: sugar-binding protein [Candidatus Omnitrophica bacterium]|nr:sugar-binding protein [Candidatus Omnitrophota bacterium]
MRYFFLRFTFVLAIAGWSLCASFAQDEALQKEEDLNFALCPKALNNPFWDEVRLGMEQAALELGVKAEFVGPTEADASLQIQKIEALLQTGIDGIGIAPNVPESVVDVIAKARDMGIPVICFDSDSPESGRLCYIGTFNESAGYEAGKLMKKFMPDGGKILIVSGGAGALNHQERIAGFERGIEDGDIEVADIQYCNDDLNRATQLIEAYVSAHPDLDGIFCTASWAVSAANVRRDKELDLVIVGFDTIEAEVQLVKDGLIEGLVGQNPVGMGYESLRTLFRLHQAGEDMEDIADDIDTGSVIVTPENVEEFANDKGYALK